MFWSKVFWSSRPILKHEDICNRIIVGKEILWHCTIYKNINKFHDSVQFKVYLKVGTVSSRALLPGLGIRSSVFQKRIACEKERIAPVALF